jgi:hypothetical protein
MKSAGIFQDVQNLISNAGLEDFVVGEPYQYAKLTMSVVQDFEYHWSQPNPMVQYKIYNKTINLPFDDFCAAIKVPQWGSREKIRGLPPQLLNLYEMICQGRSFSDESGKIRSIQLPSIRYFAYFITKCVLARKNANKLSIHDLVFLAAALQRDRTYNLGALIAFRLATNRDKGGICGGLIASRLLAMHGVEPHPLDVQLSIEKLDIVSMIKHDFVSNWSNLNNLSYEITFFKKKWRVTKSERLVGLPAPALFNLDSRESWSVTEDELDAYIERSGHHAGDGMEEAEEPLDLSSDAASSSHQHFGHVEPSSSSSAQGSYYDHAMYDPWAWNPDPRWVDLHLGQKPKLGGRYTDISLIYISYLVGTLYIHVSIFFLSFCCLLFISVFQNTKRPKIFLLFLSIYLFI